MHIFGVPVQWFFLTLLAGAVLGLLVRKPRPKPAPAKPEPTDIERVIAGVELLAWVGGRVNTPDSPQVVGSFARPIRDIGETAADRLWRLSRLVAQEALHQTTEHQVRSPQYLVAGAVVRAHSVIAPLTDALRGLRSTGPETDTVQPLVDHLLGVIREGLESLPMTLQKAESLVLSVRNPGADQSEVDELAEAGSGQLSMT